MGNRLNCRKNLRTFNNQAAYWRCLQNSHFNMQQMKTDEGNSRPFLRMLVSDNLEAGQGLPKSRECVLCAQLLNDPLREKAPVTAHLNIPQYLLADVCNTFLITCCHRVVSPFPKTRSCRWVILYHHRITVILTDTAVHCIFALRVLFEKINLLEEL